MYRDQRDETKSSPVLYYRPYSYHSTFHHHYHYHHHHHHHHHQHHLYHHHHHHHHSLYHHHHFYHHHHHHHYHHHHRRHHHHHHHHHHLINIVVDRFPDVTQLVHNLSLKLCAYPRFCNDIFPLLFFFCFTLLPKDGFAFSHGIQSAQITKF